MSLDLVFWRQSETATTAPVDIMTALLDEVRPDDVLDIDIEAVLSELLAAFPGAVREPNGPHDEWIVWEPQDEDGMFEASWSAAHLLINARGGLDTEHLNTIIDIALDHGCALYDPQLDERFQQG